ncbi:hypothetical protein [Aeromonas bestiarum]|uniref:hypothetical protein n=1 Tax=Aeromonas bestiarum TaxID=105751 RepID=UPI0011AF9E2E|nr:hypothetical protein [Aeromonas bestiarum]
MKRNLEIENNSSKYNNLDDFITDVRRLDTVCLNIYSDGFSPSLDCLAHIKGVDELFDCYIDICIEVFSVILVEPPIFDEPLGRNVILRLVYMINFINGGREEAGLAKVYNGADSQATRSIVFSYFQDISDLSLNFGLAKRFYQESHLADSISNSILKISSKSKLDYTELENQLLNRFKSESESIERKIDRVNQIENDYIKQRQKIEGLFDKFQSDFKEQLSLVDKFQSDFKEQLSFAEAKNNEIENIFKSANKKGMASAFQERRNSLRWPMYAWMFVYAIALIILFVGGIWFFQYAVSEKNIIDIAFRLPVSLPIIWLAWFSAKQYSHISRLREDYAYKSAVAMAYHGYKDETQGGDNGMHDKLLENIIFHFSENPVRLYEKHEASSPLEDFLRKLSPEGVAEFVKVLKAK